MSRRLAGLGTALGVTLRAAPGIVGPLLVATGVGMIYIPAGVITLGLALWAFDRWVL
jgi:hypothetical protein